MANQWSVGALVRCDGEFKDAAGDYQDPTAVFFKFKVHGGAVTEYEYEYGVGGQLVKDDTGRYHVNVDAASEGRWYYRFYSTGTGQAANEGWFLAVTDF